jgi:hypothetical protein
LGILNYVLKPNLLQKQSRLKVYNILPISSLLYGCEIWILKQRDMRRLKKAEMKCMKPTAGYRLLDHRRSEDNLEELEVCPVEKKLSQYKQKILNNVTEYRRIGRQNGRPLKRLLDGYNNEAETGHLLA